MNQTSKTFHRLRDPTANLQAVVERLDSITKKIESKPHSLPTSEVQAETRQENLLQRTFSLAKNLISLAFASKEMIKESSHSENEIKDVLDEIKNNYPLLERFQKGDPSQQSLAKWAFEVINRYNNTVVKAKKKPFSWDEKVAAFFYEKYGVLTADKIVSPIDLPEPAILMSGMKQQSGNTKIQQAFQTQLAGLVSLNLASIKCDSSGKFQKVYDAFKMKLISGFEQKGIPRHLVNDLIYKNPIQIVTSEDESKLFFNQVFETLPGEIYHAKYEFEKSTINPSLYDPVPGSFKLESTSTQKGFPHPSQDNGWAFCDELIPALPHRIEMLPHLHYLLIQKKNIALALLPGGKHNTHAKRIISKKRHYFNSHMSLFRELHVEIARNLICLDGEVPSSKEEAILEKFFFDSKFNYDHLSNSYSLLNELFFIRPFLNLQDARIDQTEPDLLSSSKEVRFNTAERILREHGKASEKELANRVGDCPQGHFALLLGRKLADAGAKIILQYHSEILEFTPPVMGKKEKTLQAIVYKQLNNFIEELNRDVGDIKETMFRCLENDLMVLEDYTLDRQAAQVVNELEEYYKKRDESRPQAS